MLIVPLAVAGFHPDLAALNPSNVRAPTECTCSLIPWRELPSGCRTRQPHHGDWQCGHTDLCEDLNHLYRQARWKPLEQVEHIILGSCPSWAAITE